MRYADRARKIKNKPIVNQDGKDAEIAKLKREVADMKLRLLNSGNSNHLKANFGAIFEVNMDTTNKAVVILLNWFLHSPDAPPPCDTPG